MGRPPKNYKHPELLRLIKIVGANIKLIRESRQLSQAELARRASIAATTLNELETRSCRDIRLSTLIAIATALDEDVRGLFGESNVKMSSEDREKLLRASEDILKITRKIPDEDS